MADLALGKLSSQAWALSGTRRASYLHANGMRVGGGVCRGGRGPLHTEWCRVTHPFGCVHSSHASLRDACTVHCQGVSAAITSSGGRGPEIPGGGLRNRCCVVTPDPTTTQGQSPWGASEGEERLSAATTAAYHMLPVFFMQND